MDRISQNTHRVGHLSTIHSRTDIRIFRKEVSLLARNNFKVIYFVSDGLGDSEIEGVIVKDLGKWHGRLHRMTIKTLRAATAVVCSKVELIHIHDPELLMLAPFFKLCGIRVVYDAHEDLEQQILHKYWIPLKIRKFVSKTTHFLELLICKAIDAVVTVDSNIILKFDNIVKHKIVLRNYPILADLTSNPSVHVSVTKRPYVVYAGLLDFSRGLEEMLEAASHLNSNARIVFCGRFANDVVKRRAYSHKNWSKIIFLGNLPPSELHAVYRTAAAGLALLHPINRYKAAIPVKVYEYMNFSLPVICSDFPLWVELIIGNSAGVAVDPRDPVLIANAIDELINNQDFASELGQNGRDAIVRKFNWEAEGKKLIELYEKII